MIKFLKEVFVHFSNSNASQKGAALGYYAVFSILPIIMIVTSVLGILFGEQAVSGELYSQLKNTMGSEASTQIQNIVKNQHSHHNSLLTSIIGFITLALSASGMFGQIHSTFNSIWEIKPKPKSSILNYFSQHIVSFIILMVMFFVMFTSTLLHSFLMKFGSQLNSGLNLVYVYEHLASFAVLIILFAIMFRFLGDAKVTWMASLLGGVFTALLFSFGKIGIGMYIGRSHVSSTFGSASVLALLMLWVYYSSQIIFLGASFVKVVSEKLGCEIQPNSNAVKIKHVEVTE